MKKTNIETQKTDLKKHFGNTKCFILLYNCLHLTYVSVLYIFWRVIII